MTTIACEDRDFTEWRGGAEHVLIWAVLVDVDGVRAAVDQARARWADVLLPRYERQPHVTLGYGGPVAAEGMAPADPVYTQERLDADRRALERLDLAPFDVRIGGWGTFEMSPYLRAEATELEVMAEALGEGRRRAYVPHVTVGHYSVAVPLASVAERAEGWEFDELVVPVRRVSLLRYEAADIAGPLEEITAVELR